ncbi:MAG: hypothetical protein ACLUQW_03870 [Collinsella sp.]
MKVIPTEYERVLTIVAAAEAVGKTYAQAEELAFDCDRPRECRGCCSL